MNSLTVINKQFSTLELIGNRYVTPPSPQDSTLVVRSGGAYIVGGLYVDGNINLDGIAIPEGATKDYVLKCIDNDGTAEWRPDEDYRIINGTSGNVSFHNSFGIGITEPLEALHVADNVRIDSGLVYPGILTVGTDIYFDQDKIGVGITPTESIHTSGNLQIDGVINSTRIVEPSITGNMNMQSSGRITNLQTPTNENDAATKDYVDNLILGVEWQDPVMSKSLTDPPISPDTGDRYIVAIGSTGDWNGQDVDIATWNGASWDFQTPNTNWATLVEDEDASYTYNGTAWVLFGNVPDHGNLSGLTGDDHLQYLLLAGRNGGQIVYGGTGSSDNLELHSTSNSTKGDILLSPSGGNVGIGVTETNHTLQVNGTIGIGTTGTNVYIEGISNNLYLNASGNVFIQPNGTTDGRIIIPPVGGLFLYDNDGQFTTSISVTNGSSFGKNNMTIGSNENTGDNVLTLRTGSGNSRIVLGTSGNLYGGIGVVNEDDDIVIGTISKSTILEADENLHFASGGILQMTLSSTGVLNLGSLEFAGVSGYASIQSTDGEDLVLGISGNVGIGSTTPSSALDVDGDISLSGNLNNLTLPNVTDTLVAKNTTDILTNKTLIDTSTVIANSGDNTKEIIFDVSGTTTGQTLTLASANTTDKTITFPDITDTLVTLTSTDFLENKTLDGNIINTFVSSGTTFFMPSGSSDTIVSRSSTDNLSNKTLVSPTVDGNLTQTASNYIATDQIKALSSSGLIMTNTSGSAGIILNDAGYLGIGTSNPTEILHVSGEETVLFKTDLNVADTLYVDYINGFVGIGITAPMQKFHLQGSGLITNDLVIEGDLYVEGTQYIQDTTNVAIQDNLVQYATGNTADLVDIGFYGVYIDTGTTRYSGIFRDASGDKPFRFFKDTTVLPDTTVDISATGYTKAGIVVDTVDTENISYSTDLAFNTSQFYITSGGNVGVATDNPSELFHVNGNSQLGEEIFTKSSMNKIGIGITEPIAGLDIFKGTRIYQEGSSTLTGLVSAVGSSTTITGSGTLFTTELIPGDRISFGSVSLVTVVSITSDTELDINTTAIGAETSEVATKTPAIFVVQDSSNNTIIQDGNIGIGTLVPGYPLSVEKSATWSARLVNGDSTLFLGNTSGQCIVATTTSATTGYHSRFYNDTYTILSLRNDGKVGIQTTIPQEKLHVNGSSVGDGAQIGNMKLGVWEGNASYAAMTHNDLKATSASYAISQFNTGETYLNAATAKNIHFCIANVEQGRIDSSGNLGIGTDTPSQKLHVQGNALVSGNMQVNGNLTINGDATEINTESVTVVDPIIKLAEGNSTNDLDSGLYMEYDDSGTKYSGLFRDKDDNTWKFFNGLEVEPGTTQVEFNGTGYKDAALRSGALTTSGLFVAEQGVKYSPTTITGNTTLNTEHHIILCDATSGDITVTLPESHDNVSAYIGTQYTLVKIDNSANVVSIVRSNNDLIDFTETSVSLETQGQRITLFSIGGASNIGNWLTN
jgi:hypothetical protein